MALNPPHEKEQIRAIEITLATAPKIQEDLKAKFGYGKNIFFYNDLVEYRINNSALEIDKDLELKERHDLINDHQVKCSVGSAFRGYHDEEFMSDYQFEGLLGRVTNDIIKGIRKSKGGRIMYKLGLGYHGRSKEQMTIDGLIGGKKRMELLSEEERIELALKGGLETWKLGLGIHGRSKKQMTLDSRKGVEAQGNFLWSLEHVLDIHNFREESIGKGFHSTKPSLDYVRDKMNEKHNENWTTTQLRMAYENKKHLLADEEE